MTRVEIERKEQELRDRIEELYEELESLPEPEDGYEKPKGPGLDVFSAALRDIYTDEMLAQLGKTLEAFKWFKERK